MESEFSLRKGEENARENRPGWPLCFFGLGKTGLIGDFETEIGFASWKTADCSSSISSSSDEKLASEFAPLLSGMSISVRIGSTKPLLRFRFDVFSCSSSSSVNDGSAENVL